MPGCPKDFFFSFKSRSFSKIGLDDSLSMLVFLSIQCVLSIRIKRLFFNLQINFLELQFWVLVLSLLWFSFSDIPINCVVYLLYLQCSFFLLDFNFFLTFNISFLLRHYLLFFLPIQYNFFMSTSFLSSITLFLTFSNSDVCHSFISCITA